MYESILVPLDGSPFGESALPAAQALARKTGARLHLLHVRGETTKATGLPGMAAGWGQEAERSARAYLNAMSQRVTTDTGRAPVYALVDGPVAEAISDYAVGQAISLLIMSTHGRRGLSRAWLGSVAAGVVRTSSAPVLLVRPRKGGARPGATLRIRHMLLPLDGSPMSTAIVAPAEALGKLTRAKMTLVSVVEPVYRLGEAALLSAVDYDAAHHQERERVAREHIERVATDIRSRGFEVQTRVESGDAVQMLLQTAKDVGADLIAMATHGRGGWQRLAFGSIADKLVRSSTLPVLVQRVESEEDEA